VVVGARVNRLAAVLVLLLVAVGCGSLVPTPAGSPAFGDQVDVVNDTKLDVTVMVNGINAGTIAAHSAISIPARRLPPQPWAVEARSPSGRLLLSFPVAPGQVTTTTDPDRHTTTNGVGGRVDLSCGRLDVFVGGPMLGPPPGAGRPGDCDP
jgi:hypothetical protein